ncbi:hypothetical protein ACDA27_004673 [Salmonella enterica]
MSDDDLNAHRAAALAGDNVSVRAGCGMKSERGRVARLEHTRKRGYVTLSASSTSGPPTGWKCYCPGT